MSKKKMKTFNAWSAYANHPIEQMKNVVTKIPCGQLPAERFRSDPTVYEKLNDRILIKYKTRPNIIVKGKDYGCA